MSKAFTSLARVTVVVESNEEPATEVIAACIRNKLELFGARQPFVAARKYEHSCLSGENNFDSGVAALLNSTAVEQFKNPESDFVSIVGPTFSEFTFPSGETARLGIVYITVRNRQGCEWLYTKFIGAVPASIFEAVCQKAESLLEGRAPPDEPSVDDFMISQSLIHAACVGFDQALEMNVSKRSKYKQ